MKEFRMPSLGADMEAGILVEWKVKPGDAVHKGDIVAEVETQKGNIEIEVFDDGIIDKLLVESGQEVPVGTALANILGPSEEASKKIQKPAEEKQQPEHPKTLRVGPAHRNRIRVSPLARKLALELKVDLALIHGTGPNGAISKIDVLEQAKQKKQAPHPDKKAEMAKKAAAMREAIAAAMSRSKREIPHYYLQTDINMARALAFLEEYNLNRPVTDRILPPALTAKAIAQALRQFPELNGFFVEGEFHPAANIHIGMGISLRHGGLVAPALHDVDQQSLPDLMMSFRDLVTRARLGKLRSTEMSDATITVTSLGDQGVEQVFGVIFPPQVAVIGLGRVSPRPWAKGTFLGVEPVMTTTLAADHRCSNGHRGGLFLRTIDELLQEPQKLLEEG